MVDNVQTNMVRALQQAKTTDGSTSLTIIDEAGNLVFKDGFEKDQAIKKLFNLQQLEGRQASFILHKGNKVIREAIVKL